MTVEESLRPRGLSNPRDFQDANFLKHPGNHPVERYQTGMSRVRYAMRSYLTRFTDNQSSKLYEWQANHRTTYRDIFFAYTSLLASHTFYVLCLPIPAFIGQVDLVRDMVYVLGYSIYLSGFLKDYWCLPRPRSPPLHRITLSAYTALEYGAPSSHSANATGVTFLLLWNTWRSATLGWFGKSFCSILALCYYLTLVAGRIYCGMHGLLDIISGAAIGVVCFAARIAIKNLLKDFKLGDHLWFPFFSISWGLLLLFKHVRPIEECPCFQDSVAFIGVVSGFECSEWLLEVLKITSDGGMGIQKGFQYFIYRLVVGVACVALWKYCVSQTLVYCTLLEVLRLPDDRPEKTAAHAAANEEDECPLYIGEPKIDIIGRFFIYAGIPFVVLVICPPLFSFLNITSS
ncbi:hypothetical protein HG536_0F01020 [Torulaspora globosa]|uniref:Phosphatidic acid phosphatase type 2/haloperoxidase domain-containing protein n=1 Tax=Torulaspora globosa TaxID=48254 RepID=A0A7G3ZJU1_9SACH|nr:uncharacterized protein HG536_0F01020 [Torulaspora globosa]QLL33777.1 hypothetical protein HG536_0F01020 [Torulaspora globosa]